MVAIHPRLAMIMLALLAAAPIMWAVTVVPRAALLPALSVVLIALGFALGDIAWWRKADRHGATVTPWGMAGAAAMPAWPENVLQVFAETVKP
jgi:hypothetical protein